MKFLIAMSGASGAIYGIKLLETLKQMAIQADLIVSKNAELTIKYETDFTPDQVRALAHQNFPIQDLGAACASGSNRYDAMIVAPCSMKSLGEIALSITSNLLTRAAEVQLKERRRLVLLTRETPLTLQHCRNMAIATENGAIIMPPLPMFYQKPQTIDEMVSQTIFRVLSICGLECQEKFVWRDNKS